MDYPPELDPLISELRQVKLTAAERRRMRGQILRAMNHSSEPWHQRVLQWWQAALTTSATKRQMAVSALLVIFLAGGTSVAQSAESTLPGQLLYDVKINLTEEVRASFSSSAEDRAVWDIERVTRRLEEVERLANQANVSTNVISKLDKRFRHAVERAEKSIAKLDAQGLHYTAAYLSSNLEASLQAHEQILAALNNQTSSSVFATVHAKSKASTEVRAQHETDLSTNSSPDNEHAATGRLGATQNKLAEVRKLIENKKDELGAEATAEAEAKLHVAQTVMTDGQAKLAAGEFAEAFRLFQEAHRIARQAKTLMIARADLHVSVSINPPALERAAEPPPGLIKKIDSTQDVPGVGQGIKN
jgi:tetratricopeptide (TPR) repeat protein